MAHSNRRRALRRAEAARRGGDKTTGDARDTVSSEAVQNITESDDGNRAEDDEEEIPQVGKTVAVEEAVSTRSDAAKRRQARKFEDLRGVLLSDFTVNFTNSKGFEEMTPVQDKTIELFMGCSDVAVQACTGSGKTLAFLIPLVEKMLQMLCPSICAAYVASGVKEESAMAWWSDSCCTVGGLVLAPTRELASQIHSVLIEYLGFVWSSAEVSGEIVKALLLTGGNDVEKDRQSVLSTQFAVAERKQESCSSRGGGTLGVVIATPGRLSHLMSLLHEPREWTFKRLEFLVLDEADRLLELGFSQHLTEILSRLPKQRRTGLFSATLSSELSDLVKVGMRNPKLVRVTVRRQTEPQAAPLGSATAADEVDKATMVVENMPMGLRNYVLILSNLEKMTFLVKFVNYVLQPPSNAVPSGGAKCIVFLLTCACVDYCHTLLGRLLNTEASTAGTQQVKSSGGFTMLGKLHGRMTQGARQKTLTDFVAASNGLLIVTDVAARGIDVPDVDWIIQMDPPQDPAFFIHRIGRTARAGRSGSSLVMLTSQEDAYVHFLKKRKIQLVPFSTHPLSEHLLADMQTKPDAIETYGGGELVSDVSVPPLISSAHCPSVPSSLLSVVSSVVLETLRRTKMEILEDRDVMLKATLAFVSYIRAYKEHKLGYIFPFKALNIGHLATGLGLLRIPRMKEILGRRVPDFEQHDVDPSTIPFRDFKKEAKRLANLETENAQREAKRKWRAERKAFSSKFDVQRNRRRKDVRRSQQANTVKEITSMYREELLTRRLRKGRVSLAGYADELQNIDPHDETTESIESSNKEKVSSIPRWARSCAPTPKRRKCA